MEKNERLMNGVKGLVGLAKDMTEVYKVVIPAINQEWKHYQENKCPESRSNAYSGMKLLGMYR